MENLGSGDSTRDHIYVDLHRETFPYPLLGFLRVWYVKDMFMVTVASSIFDDIWCTLTFKYLSAMRVFICDNAKCHSSLVLQLFRL